MKVCLNTRSLGQCTLEEVISAAKAAEISVLELAAQPGSLHLNPLLDREYLDTVRAQLGDMEVAAIDASGGDLPRLPLDGGNEAVEYTIGAFRAAEYLGAKVVNLSLGATDVDAWDAAWTRSMEALRDILRHTGKTGVRLAVELHQDDVFDSLRKARRLLETFPDRRLGITIDTAFCHYRRIQLSEVLLVAGPRLFHVHLRDATRSDPYRPIGEGEVSFPSVFRSLREHGYRGAVSLELISTAETNKEDQIQAVLESARRLWALLPR